MKHILSKLKLLCPDSKYKEFGELSQVMKDFNLDMWYPFEDNEEDVDYKNFKKLITDLESNEIFKYRIKKAIIEDKILNLQTPDHNFRNSFLQYWIANDVSDKALRILRILKKNDAIKEGLYGDETQDFQGRTALHLAIAKKYDNPMDKKHFRYHKFDHDLIEFLIDNCSKKTLLTQDELGNTPLHYAIYKTDEELVKKILTKADEFGLKEELLSIKNKQQKTPHDLCDETFEDSQKTIDKIYTGYELVENPQKTITRKNCFGKKTYKKYDQIKHSTLKCEEQWNKSRITISKIINSPRATTSPSELSTLQNTNDKIKT
jgi:hypothetical protein